MLVKQAIELLQSCDPDAVVIMAKDPEGNGYSPLSGVYGGELYFPETTWSGQCVSASDPEEIEEAREFYNITGDGEPAVCLVSIN
jgi:hypothetical protein